MNLQPGKQYQGETSEGETVVFRVNNVVDGTPQITVISGPQIDWNNVRWTKAPTEKH